MVVYDLVVIGSGAAGATAATTAIHQGASRVAIVDHGPLWGTCVNTGCIPSKFLLRRAENHYYKNYPMNDSGTASRFDLHETLAEKDLLIRHLRQKKTDRIITGLGIEFIEGSAEFLSATELKAGSRKLDADRFIIATGSSPVTPPVAGIAEVPFLTNVEGLSPERIPESLIIIGGRAQGLEFAQLFAHLGTRVTLLQRSSRILPEEEPEIADMLSGYLRDEGIEIQTGVDIRRADKLATGVAITALSDGREQMFSAEQVLLAAGRSPNTKGLGLERAGVRTGPGGAVLVDATMKTSIPHIWAAGDVTGEPMLETAARYAGEIAAMNAFSELKRSFNRHFIPYGIFTSPQVAGVGMTEIQARSAGLGPETRSIGMNAMARASIDGDTRGMVKIVVDGNDGCVLGVHVCSPVATEILEASVFAVTRHLPVSDLADTYQIFPTLGEAVAVCARQFRKNTTGCAL
jgi:mercuric reductase